MDFGVRAKYDPAFPLVSWHHGQFFINLTNVMAICCRMPMAELVLGGALPPFVLASSKSLPYTCAANKTKENLEGIKRGSSEMGGVDA